MTRSIGQSGATARPGSDSARTWEEVKRRAQSCPYLYRVPVSGKRQSKGTKKWLSGQAAHFASAARFQLSGFDALPYGVRPMADIEPQSAEFLFDLQSIERASGCFLRNERLQVLA